MAKETKLDVTDPLEGDIDRLTTALKDVIDALNSDVKEEVEAARVKGESLLKEVQSRMTTDHYGIRQAARNTISNVDFYVYDKPWQSIGVGAAIGLVIGALLGSRCRS